jgi:hypothetical protein
MNPLWSYLAVGFLSFSLGIILGCLMMMRGDKPEISHQHILDKDTEIPAVKTAASQINNGK